MKKIFQGTLWVLFCAIAWQATAQPATQLYLAKIKVKSSGVKVGKVKKMSEFKGYNNQPHFSPNGKTVYYTANQGGKQTDIFAYEVKSGKTKRLINTQTSEYSPTITPDGQHFSCIMVEADGTQRLWKFPLKGGKPSVVLPSIKPVGYHAWVDDDALILFVLGDKNKPNTLQLASAKKDQAKMIVERIGRCFGKVPNQAKTMSFVHKPQNGEWVIKQLNIDTRYYANITPTLKGSEDYVWTKNGGIIMGQGTKLFLWKQGQQWKEIADLSSNGIKKITRLAINPKNNLLVIVGQ
ncbi:MAG TPA: hypothetical protein DCS93_30985 [Microscillaceae bacterium]|nr:hypothetical protein [Microscillaceae bacterium]